MAIHFDQVPGLTPPSPALPVLEDSDNAILEQGGRLPLSAGEEEAPESRFEIAQSRNGFWIIIDLAEDRVVVRLKDRRRALQILAKLEAGGRTPGGQEIRPIPEEETKPQPVLDQRPGGPFGPPAGGLVRR